MQISPASMLGGLPFQAGIVTRQITPENPTGGKGAACPWEPDPGDPFLPHSRAAVDLGKGWKVRPFITLPSGHTAVLAVVLERRRGQQEVEVGDELAESAELRPELGEAEHQRIVEADRAKRLDEPPERREVRGWDLESRAHPRTTRQPSPI